MPVLCEMLCVEDNILLVMLCRYVGFSIKAFSTCALLYVLYDCGKWVKVKSILLINQ